MDLVPFLFGEAANTYWSQVLLLLIRGILLCRIFTNVKSEEAPCLFKGQ
jgi:hypothetical protein